MLLPPSILHLVKLIERLKQGLDIDEVWVEGPKVEVVSGKFKLPDKDTLTIKSEYKLANGTKQKIEAIYKDGDNNNELKIDGVEQDLISIKLKPDFDGYLTKATVELEAAIKYKDTLGVTRSIKLSSEQIKLVGV